MSGENATVLAGRYRIVRQLGQGGMGSVWLAEDTKLDGFKVAIKMLPSVLVNNKRAYAQVKAEALVSLKLSHPNIVTVRAFEEEGGSPFLVMDYIDGQTLDDYLAEKGKLTEDETIKLLKPVAAALDYAHTQGVVHRDVKPGNIMIRKDGMPFILDFGIAREIQETMTRVTGKLSSGTLMYMSPEQLNGQKPTTAQDVYSFAAMAYECLAGEPPFCRGQIEYQILHNLPEPFQSRNVFGDNVLCGLSKDPTTRPLTCLELFELLPRKENSIDAVNAEHFAKAEIGGCEKHNPVEYEVLMAKVRIRRHDIELAYDKVVEFCRENSGYSICQENAWELMAKAEVNSHPATSVAAKACLAKLEEIKEEMSGVVLAEQRRRDEISKYKGLDAEFETVILPAANKYKASTYASDLYVEGMNFKEQGHKAAEGDRYAAAVQLLSLAKDRLKRATQEAKMAYVETILTVARDYETAGMTEDFLRTVRKGLEIYPDNRNLKIMLQEQDGRDRKNLVLCSTIDGREVRGARVEVGGMTVLRTPIRVSDCDELLLSVPHYLKYEEEGRVYVGRFDAAKIDCAKGGRFIMVPLRKYPKLSEMISMCRSSPKCDFWFPMCHSVVLALFVGVLVGVFAAGCSEGGNKILVGFSFGVLAASFLFLMFLRAGLSDEVEKILFDGVEYDQRTSSDFMGEGIL